MKKNTKALSLIIAIGLSLVMSILALFILEYIIPFSKNTKNIEQSVSAYYQADSAIEDSLYYNSIDTLDPNLPRDYGIEIESSGTILPPSGNGNSEFDSDFNIIRTGEPIQIEIGRSSLGSSLTLSNFYIFFRVPDINGDGTYESLSGGSLKIINWQLSGYDDVLNASGSQITAEEINGSDISIENRDGLNLSDSGATFKEFYSDGSSDGVIAQCSGVGSGCVLKMSVINKLETTTGKNVPYLEWRIETNESIPLRYKIIDTTGKSYGFQKNLRVKIPQQTLNEAFDFTVFQ